ncbi:MAG: cysteine peptidase family C39 domain-containing protein [Luminiphilus sp.]|nr:cysteine peptidase family C39 domain-containing protein [Luminiphilus sp.]
MAAQGQFDSSDMMQPSSNNPAMAGMPNDCGLRAVAFVLAEKGFHSELEGLADLLSFRYAATGGRPIGEGYSLSDLQWLLNDFGIQSRGVFASKFWLQRRKQSTVLRIPGKMWGHFVVLRSIDASGVAKIYDPTQGVIEIPLGVLASRWANSAGQGIALVTESTMHASHDIAE